MNETNIEVLPGETIEGSGEVTVASQNRDGIVKTIARQIEAVNEQIAAFIRQLHEEARRAALQDSPLRTIPKNES